MATDWSSIADIVSKICEIADKLGWEELADMVISAYDDMAEEKDQSAILFTWYYYFMRLYYRVRRMTEPRAFNIVYNDSRLEDHSYIEMYRVVNYDFKMFQWARKKGFTQYMNNDWFLVPKDSLTDKEKENFEKKVEKDTE